MTSGHLIRSSVLSASVFAAAGALSRYELRLTETRYQIAAFVAAAVGIELIAAAARLTRASWLRGLANAIAATLVIVTVKFQLEPQARANDTAVVRHAAHAVAKDVREAR